MNLSKGDIVINNLPIIGEFENYDIASFFVVLDIIKNSELDETSYKILSHTNEILYVHIPSEEIYEFGWKEDIFTKVE